MNAFAAPTPAARTARLRSLRRVVALSAAALAVVGLTACGGGTTAPTSDGPTAVATAAPVTNSAAPASRWST